MGRRPEEMTDETLARTLRANSREHDDPTRALMREASVRIRAGWRRDQPTDDGREDDA